MINADKLLEVVKRDQGISSSGLVHSLGLSNLYKSPKSAKNALAESCNQLVKKGVLFSQKDGKSRRYYTPDYAQKYNIQPSVKYTDREDARESREALSMYAMVNKLMLRGRPSVKS